MTTQQDILLLPFMAQGHLIPFVSLATLISQRNPTFTITIVTTPLNIQSLKPLLPSNSNIHLHSLPFCPSDHGLPSNAENSDCLPIHLIPTLMHASESLHPYFHHLVQDMIEQGRRLLCIVSDVFFGWTVAIARAHGIFHATFTTCSAYGTAAYMSLWLHLPHTHTDAEEFNLPGFPPSFRLRRSQLSHYMKAADGSDSWSTFLQKHIKLSCQSDALLCNTADAVEPRGTKILRSITGLRVWAIGPLLGEQCAPERPGMPFGVSLKQCVEWLEGKAPESVIYIAFGSQNTISATQIIALAEALEAIGRPFIWVVRPPVGNHLQAEFRSEWLPENFEQRMGERKQGLVIKGWAPQRVILSNRSTALFVSHCGWNSVQESLVAGVPMIGWPLGSEQYYNAKVLEEEVGVCVQVRKGVEGDVGKEEVKRVVEEVMEDGEKWKTIRERARWCSAAMKAATAAEGSGGRGDSVAAVDEFIEAAVNRVPSEIDSLSSV